MLRPEDGLDKRHIATDVQKPVTEERSTVSQFPKEHFNPLKKVQEIAPAASGWPMLSPRGRARKPMPAPTRREPCVSWLTVGRQPNPPSPPQLSQRRPVVHHYRVINLTSAWMCPASASPRRDSPESAARAVGQNLGPCELLLVASGKRVAPKRQKNSFKYGAQKAPWQLPWETGAPASRFGYSGGEDDGRYDGLLPGSNGANGQSFAKGRAIAGRARPEFIVMSL